MNASRALGIRRLRPWRVRAQLLALVVGMTLTACGGGVVPGAGQATASGSPTERPTVQVTPSASASIPDCPDEVLSFVTALKDLDSRLDVGLNFSDYGAKVGDAKVLYDRIDAGSLSLACVSDVGVHAEKALNAYIDANNTWNACVTDVNCDNDSITPDLQAKWSEATTEIKLADDALHP